MASELIVVPSICLTIAFITWAVVNGWRQAEYREEIYKANARLVDRIGSVNDLTEFIRSDAGAQFLKLSAIDDKAQRPAVDRVLGMMQIGVIFASVGFGLFFAGSWFYFTPQGVNPFVILGVISFSGGIGCLISALLLYRFRGGF
jgi:hypothetical protein